MTQLSVSPSKDVVGIKIEKAFYCALYPLHLENMLWGYEKNWTDSAQDSIAVFGVTGSVATSYRMFQTGCSILSGYNLWTMQCDAKEIKRLWTTESGVLICCLLHHPTTSGGIIWRRTTCFYHQALSKNLVLFRYRDNLTAEIWIYGKHQGYYERSCW